MKLGPKSWTHLEQEDECQLAYQFRYIDKVQFKKPEAMRFGGGFHEARFRYYSHCADIGRDSDWSAMPEIARSSFKDKELPLDRWEEFLALCRLFAENRPFNPKMGVEVKFGVNRNMDWADFDEADFFRGIVDGLEINGDMGVVTDAKTSRSTTLSFSQIKIYAAFLSLHYPEVKEWKLVYDFVRMNRQVEERVLAANLAEVRHYVRARVERIETRKKFKAQPGEHCLSCPFLSRCDYRIRGLKALKSQEDVRTAMEDHWFLKAQAAQAKRLVKTYVEDFGEVETQTLRADFFPSEKVTCDKPQLVKLLKVYHRKPLDYVDFSKVTLRKLMKDKEIADDAANLIFIDTSHKFGIRKRGKEEDEPEEGQQEE